MYSLKLYTDMVRFWSQIVLLCWKHQILMRRRKRSTFCEFLALAFMSFLMIMTIYKIERINDAGGEFVSVPITGGYEDINYVITNSTSFNNTWHCNDNLQKEMTLAYSCEGSSCDEKDAKNIMNKLVQWYNNSRLDFVTYPFVDLETMKKTLFSDLDSNYGGCPKFIGGVYFSKIHKQVPELNYVILLPRSVKGLTWDMKGISKFWQDEGPDAPQQASSPFANEPNYWKSGFLSLQYAIEKAFIELVGGNVSLSNVEVHLSRMPIRSVDKLSVIFVLLRLYQSVIVLLFALFMLKDIALERDSWIMTYMSVMGLNQLGFYVSHFLIAALKMLPFAVTFSAMSANKHLEYISPSLYICVFTLFCITTLVLALFLGILFKKFTQMGPFLVLVILVVLPLIYPPDINDVPLCILESLNPLHAINIAINLFMRSEYRLLKTGWLSMFTKDQFLVGIVFLMLLFDAFFFSLLAFYVAMVMPAKGAFKHHPLFFLRPHSVSSRDESDIVVNKMCKKWPSVSQFAVDNLSFKALRGQITVLLGRNGAGKSTTFSVLTGMINYDSGQVFICGDDLKKGLRQCQDNMGFCPQYNPLFDHLTIREHLQFYAGMKSGRLNGPHGKSALGQEIQRVAGEMGIGALLDMQARKLSGGQKRKLCVAIALIANSRVVLLDEPSAGMDPEARRELGQMLEKIKHDRTILLTTHYMEEADTLGDRIVIIVNGRLVCNGYANTFEELEQMKGDQQPIKSFGLSLNTLEQVFLRVNELADTAVYAGGTDSVDGPMKLADDLFGLRQQQFLKSSLDLVCLWVKQIAAILCRQLLWALRNPFDSFGSLILLLLAFFVPFTLIIHGNRRNYVERSLSPAAADQYFSIQLEFAESAQYKNSFNELATKIPYGTTDEKYPLVIGASELNNHSKIQLVAQFSGVALHSAPMALSFVTNALLGKDFVINPKIAIYDIADKNYEEKSLSRALRLFAVILMACLFSCMPCFLLKSLVDDRSSCFKHQLLLTRLHPFTYWTSITIWHSILGAQFSGVALHSAPMALSFVTNALLGKDFAITPKIAIYDIADKNGEEKSSRNFLNNMAAILMGCIFSCMPCFLLKSLVDDRSSCFKHQLLLTRNLDAIVRAFILSYSNHWIKCWFVKIDQGGCGP
uniref:ABC transporter domain-containing protein n=1 Tax=Globodera pallida TaxID=36090 RepID=A0A183BZN6_GLOPA